MGILLGIDVGQEKTGVARSTGSLAEPLVVIRGKNLRVVADRIADLAEQEHAQLIVIGLPQGNMETFVHEIATWLSAKGVTVELADETLTTHDAQVRAIQAGIHRKKRKTMEDAYAATLMLQAYLDSGK